MPKVYIQSNLKTTTTMESKVISKQDAVKILFDNNFRENENIAQNEEITDEIDFVINYIFYSNLQKDQRFDNSLHILFMLREIFKCREKE